MSTIKVRWCDYLSKTLIVEAFEARFEIDEASEPDYIIYSVAGQAHLQYPNAVRIFISGENQVPDFNIADYGLSGNRLAFGDRYLRAPVYVHFPEYTALIADKRSNVTEAELASRRFCNFIYSNENGSPARSQLFEALSQYKPIDAPGRQHNNMNGDAIGAAHQGDWWTPKVAFQRNYKFSVAAENSATPGYVTEKIVHAMAAGTIPIYWGAPDVARDFNPQRFINCHDYSSWEAVVARVRELDRDESAFLEMVNQPFFNVGGPDASLLPNAWLDFIADIFKHDKATVYRRCGAAAGYEQARRAEVEAGQALATMQQENAKLAEEINKLAPLLGIPAV